MSTPVTQSQSASWCAALSRACSCSWPPKSDNKHSRTDQDFALDREVSIIRIQHWQDAASLLLGVWLVVSPFVLGFAGADV